MNRRLVSAAATCGLFLVACGSNAGTPPEVTSARITQNPASVLSATIDVGTDVPSTLAVEVIPAEGEPWAIPYDGPLAMDHTVPVLGLRAETEYRFAVTAMSESGGTTRDEGLELTTDALPEDFPPIDANVIDASAMEPGVTFFNVFRWAPGIDNEWGYLVAVDDTGAVVWYHRMPYRSDELRKLPNGNLLFVHSDEVITELDMMGNVLSEVAAAEVGGDTFHHEAFPLESGNRLTLGTELRTVSGYGDGTVSHDVVGDTLMEVSPAGDLVHEWSTLDLLDPLRVRPGFDLPFWNQRYADVSEGTKDWTHGNAIIHDPRDDSMIVSLRHQDWLIKVDRASGELVWRLGEEGDFTMEGEGQWPYHQHAPEITADGTLLIYDNGNARTGLTEGEAPFTRVVEYALDEEAMTAEQVWEYRGETPYFAPFVGDSDRLENGNTLITDGRLVSDPSLSVFDPENLKSAKIVEVTAGPSPRAVFEVTVRDDSSEPTGYSVYRAERTASLYGPGEAM